MRQAGRYMEEYRTLRAKYPFLTLCENPDLATQITLDAVNAIGADAASLFSDILLILRPMGLPLDYRKDEGPRIDRPIRTVKDIEALRVADAEDSLGFVMTAVRHIRSALKAETPLIGFAGAPFTLASYMIEGGGSKNYLDTKRLMHSEPKAWDSLMRKISDSLISYLNAQIDAGADALQLFDSWVGCLSPVDYRQYVLPYSRRVLKGLKKKVPVIHFGTQTAGFLESFAEAGGDVIGVDWRIGLADAWKRVGSVALQGNLDPAILCGPWKDLQKAADRILKEAKGKRGHIFNLGHGVLPQTPVDNVKRLVEYVHEQSGSPAKDRRG